MTATPATLMFTLMHMSRETIEMTGMQYVGGLAVLMESAATEFPSIVAPKLMVPLVKPMPKVRQT